MIFIFIGLALLRVGEAQNELSSIQMEFGTKVRQGFLFDVSEILGTVREFDHLRKKLENRRLDYDAKQNKLNKSKKEKPQLEEEARAAQFKYEETYNDLLALMSHFGEREESLLGSLVEFAEIQAEYFKNASEVTARMIKTLHDSGLEAKARNYGLMKTSSFNKSNSSVGRINPTKEVKAIIAPTIESNKVEKRVDWKENRAEAFHEKHDRKQEIEGSKSWPAVSGLYKMRALYDFKAETADDLGFVKEELINVTGEIDENWLTGEIVQEDGTVRKGMFPSNYAQKITGAEIKGISEEALGQMKSILPGGSVSDITAAIGNVKLKSSGGLKKFEHPSKSEPSTETVPECSTCGCNEFSPNAFKKGHCNMCFHKH